MSSKGQWLDNLPGLPGLQRLALYPKLFLEILPSGVEWQLGTLTIESRQWVMSRIATGKLDPEDPEPRKTAEKDAKEALENYAQLLGPPKRCSHPRCPTHLITVFDLDR